MPGPKDFLFGVLVPAVLCGLVLLIAWGRRGANGDPVRGRIAGAFAIGLGYLAAHAFLFGAPVVPAADRVLAARDWIPWIVLAALVLTSAEALRPLRRAFAWIAPMVLLVSIVAVSLRAHVGEWIGELEYGAVSVALVAGWGSTEALARRTKGSAVPLVLWVISVATSISALLASSASIAQIAAALAGCLGAAVVLGWWNPRLVFAGGGVTLALVLIGGCLINAVYFSTLSRGSALLLLFSLVVPWFGELPWFDALGSKSKALVRAGCAALPAASAVVLTKLAASESIY